MCSRSLRHSVPPITNHEKFLKIIPKFIRLPLLIDWQVRYKRIRFVISSVTLTILLLVSTFFSFDLVWIFFPVFILLSMLYVLFSSWISKKLSGSLCLSYSNFHGSVLQLLLSVSCGWLTCAVFIHGWLLWEHCSS